MRIFVGREHAGRRCRRGRQEGSGSRNSATDYSGRAYDPSTRQWARRGTPIRSLRAGAALCGLAVPCGLHRAVAAVRPDSARRRGHRRHRPGAAARRRRRGRRSHHRDRGSGLRAGGPRHRCHGPGRGARLHRRAGPVGHDAAGRWQRRESPAPGHHERDHRRGWLAGVLDADTADSESLAPFGITVDWTGFDGYFNKLRQTGTTVNVGTFVPATMVRRSIVGMDNRPPTPEELSRMEAMVDQAMRDGAFGLSSALIYVPGSFAKTEELVALARVAAKHKGIYITHIRGESFNLFNALDEAIRIGREAGLPVVIFHLKVGAKANWGRMNEAVAKIEKANAAGSRVTATMYPYTAGGTGLAATLPLWVQEGGREKMIERLKDPAIRARARTEIETKMDGWENLLMAATFEGIQVAGVPRDFDQSIVGKRIPRSQGTQDRSLADLFSAAHRQRRPHRRAVSHDERSRT